MKLFYSWQSDIQKHINSSFIDEAIRTALREIQELNPDQVITADRDTKGEAGAVDIQQTILKKIKSADMFVFDVSIINSQCEGIKKSINSNVAFELGYAVSEAGWSNIILVFNENYGDVKRDIPFDLQRHRAITYNFDGDNAKRKNSIKYLTGQLKDAILKIMNNPNSNDEFDDIEQKKKIHDEKVIRQFFQQFSIAEFENFVKNIIKQKRSSDGILKYYEQIYDYVTSSRYFLHDKEFEKLTKQFIKKLEAIFDTEDGIHHDIYRKELYGGIFIDWDQFTKELNSSKNKLRDIIGYVKENYIDIEF